MRTHPSPGVVGRVEPEPRTRRLGGMCRLAAYHGPPLPLHAVMFGGKHSLYRQSWAARELLTGSVNVDGYGIAWRDDHRGTLLRLARVGPIWHDPDLPALLHAQSSRTALAALRNATPGLPVDASSVLPFVRGEWALALNGFVPEFRARHMRALREPLSDRRYAELLTSSDAETLFQLVLTAMDDGAAPDEALLFTGDRVARGLEPGSWAPLTMALQGPGGLWILHTAVHGRSNSLYVGRDTAMAPGGVLVVSERLDEDPAWEPVPEHSLVQVTDEGVRVTPVPGS